MRKKVRAIEAVVAVMMAVAGCASLSKTQVKAVSDLTLKSDSLLSAPSVMFSQMAQVRRERGALYAASLTTPDAHLQEVQAVAAAFQADTKLTSKAQVYVDVLQSYIRALRSLTNETRWRQYGTELRGVGSRMDSIITKYNALELSDPLPEGVVKSSSRLTALLAENYMKNRQARAVREFVTAGDTLVQTCVDALVELLKKGDLRDLITNETDGLSANYLAYLRRMELAGSPVSYTVPAHYLELRETLYTTEQIRTRCITALQAFARAHHKLPERLSHRGAKRTEWLDYWYTELLDLNLKLNQLYQVIK